MLKEKPENCLVIEDTKHGVTSAKMAGMKVVAITTTCNKSELKKADIIIKDFSELTYNFIMEI